MQQTFVTGKLRIRHFMYIVIWREHIESLESSANDHESICLNNRPFFGGKSEFLNSGWRFRNPVVECKQLKLYRWNKRQFPKRLFHTSHKRKDTKMWNINYGNRQISLASRYIYLINQARGPYWENIGPSLDSTDRAQRDPYKKDQGPIFSQDGPEQAWLIRDLLHDWNCLEKNPNDRLQRHQKLQAHNFYLEQTQRLLMSYVFKRRKTKLEENKNNILCGVNTFRK